MSRFVKLPSGLIVPRSPGVLKPNRVAGLSRRAFMSGLGAAIIPRPADASFLINSYSVVAPSGGGVPTLDSKGTASTTTSGSSFTTAITVPVACNLLAVVAHWGRNAATTFTSMAYNSVALTLAANTGVAAPANKAYVAIAYLFNPATGSSLNLNFQASAYDEVSLTYYFITGASASPNHANNAANQAANVGTAYSINLTTSVSTLIIGGRCRCRNAAAITGTPGSGYTEDYDAPLNGVQWDYSQSKTDVVTGTVAFDCTASAAGAAGDTDAIAAMAIV